MHLMPKRGPDVDLAAAQNGVTAAFLMNAMTAASEPKKPKLDTSLMAFATASGLQNSNQNLLLYNPLQGLPSTSTNSQIPTALAQSASNVASIATAALLNYQPTTSKTPLAPIDPSGNPISKVVHLRNIPSDMSELELIHFCLPFGKLYNYLMLKGKNQAFVQYEDEAGAQTIVYIAHAHPMAIRGKTIFCQYSTHQELKTERKMGKNGTLVTDSMVPSANLLISGNSATQNQLGNSQAGSSTNLGSNSASQLDISSSGTQQQPNSILRVIVDNLIYPVTLDILYSIFSRYGKVLRIITFSKNHTFQVLVQFGDVSLAQAARNALDGQNVYNGCCTLRIDYSKLTTLNVKYNNDKSRDYTNPLLPAGELSFEQQLSLATQNQLTSLVPNVYSLTQNANAASIQNTIYSQQQAFTADALNNSAANAAVAQANALAPFLNGLGGNLAALTGVSNSTNNLTSSINAANTLIQQQLGGLLASSSVVLVSNLDENEVGCDQLFTLFGVYGDVQRVKILFNKKDNALIQYAEPQQAQQAIQNLDKCRWHGKVIRVAFSKHTNVQMPKDGQPDSGLTKDYTNSSLHRFKKPGSKNYLNIYPPNSTLHLSNIPPSITEDFIKKAFEDKGFVIKDFQFFQRDHKMALLQLEDVEASINALVALHNHKLAENAHLRVSFSKKGLKV